MQGSPPIRKGERVIVSGWNDIDTRVANVEYVHGEARWKITLHWGEMGVSYVYDTDEGKRWRRYSNVN